MNAGFCILITSFLLAGYTSHAQVLWDNFEDVRKIDFGEVTGEFAPYTANPDVSLKNPSKVAASYTRNATELSDAISMYTQMEDLATYVYGGKQIQMDIWSPFPGKTIQIVLENSILAQPDNFPVGRHSVYQATTSLASTWEKLTFNFDHQPDESVLNTEVDRLSLQFDPNSSTSDQYFWDNLYGPAFADDPCSGVSPDPDIFNDFECNQSLCFSFSHGAEDFWRVSNPDQSGLNTSTHVASYTRNPTIQNDLIISFLNQTIYAAGNTTVSLDVWDPAAPTNIILLFQYQDEIGSYTVQNLPVQTTVSNNWETLTADLSEVEGDSINKIGILFDPGNFSAENYFFDNIRIGGGTTAIEEITQVSSLEVFPNPSSGQTYLRYSLDSKAFVRLMIFDQSGKIVAIPEESMQAPGQHTIVWSAEQGLSDGLYIYTLFIDHEYLSGKILLMR